MKTLYICSHCNSENVQVKGWVKPNQGHAFVEEVEGDDMGWCEDEQLFAVIDTANLDDDAKVLGFQVVGQEGTPQDGKMHPDMDASFCIYNLEQANQMLSDDGENQWQLLTIWKGDIEEPTLMFSGDPRN